MARRRAIASFIASSKTNSLASRGPAAMPRPATATAEASSARPVALSIASAPPDVMHCGLPRAFTMSGQDTQAQAAANLAAALPRGERRIGGRLQRRARVLRGEAGLGA